MDEEICDRVSIYVYSLPDKISGGGNKKESYIQKLSSE